MPIENAYDRGKQTPTVKEAQGRKLDSTEKMGRKGKIL